jgi:hypothetical protein
MCRDPSGPLQSSNVTRHRQTSHKKQTNDDIQNRMTMVARTSRSERAINALSLKLSFKFLERRDYNLIKPIILDRKVPVWITVAV